MLETRNRSPRRGDRWRGCYAGCYRGKPGELRAGRLGLVCGTAGKGPGGGRGTHSCLEVVWKLSEKCLVLDGKFGRRMSVSGMCQEVVWNVSGVRDENSKPKTGRPLTGLLHCVVHAGRPASCWRAFGLGRETAGKGSGVAHDPHSCLEVVWKLSGTCLVLDRRFDRRMRVSGMCQEVVWKVSGVRRERSKAVAGRPLTGSVRGIVQGRSWRVAGGHLGLV